ncbi:hypothetical protein Mgra_00007498 [Meloidogyne graminicola]|uniref:Uncharacterized protein n=1 Tax=Meloidogyne graminicola TaxID=189291 RepID=A0A8S9ZIF8_9BILA|nr:hypothetical protein Mgra_00007498 [Meloidogyne graminicola]
MNYKKQRKFRLLPMELYFGIFEAINTVPVKISNKPNKFITIKQWNKYIHKLLLSSRIVYIVNKETFYETKKQNSIKR